MGTRAQGKRTKRTNGGGAAQGASSYDRFKDYQGQRYTGMKVGRGHKWRYDAGEWREKKVTPDRWDFQYSVTKRRAGKAPAGSGAPVGTAYRWYILADQIVTKQDANSYTTEMAGLKYKVAHRRADKETWSASDAAQRRRLVKLLRETIAELEATPDQPASRVDAGVSKPRTASKSRTASKPRAASKARGASKPRTASKRRAAGRKAGRAGTRRRSLAA
jgi:hypothetical protein